MSSRASYCCTASGVSLCLLVHASPSGTTSALGLPLRARPLLARAHGRIVPMHGFSSAAADVLLHLVRLASADQHGDLPLGVLGITGTAAGCRGGTLSSAASRAVRRGPRLA